MREWADREDIPQVEEQLQGVTTRSASGDRETSILIAAILRIGHCCRLLRLSPGTSKEAIAAGRQNPSESHAQCNDKVHARSSSPC